MIRLPTASTKYWRPIARGDKVKHTANQVESQLQQALQEFDGKEVAPLATFLAATPYDEQLGDLLLERTTLADQQMQRGATWLLKRAGEEGAVFSSEQASQMVDLLGSVTHWEARLHLLQLFATVPIASERRSEAFTRCRALSEDENKFVRAWAYNALHVLATAEPAFRDEVTGLLMRAQHEEAASVRARIRNAVKGSPWYTTA